jgi:hypothetical protein
MNDEDCPAAGDYPVECRPSSSGSDPTGDCIITCDTTADCPSGMACAMQWYCVWA